MSTQHDGLMMDSLLASAVELESGTPSGHEGELPASDDLLDPGETVEAAIARPAAEIVDEQDAERGVNPAPDDPNRLARLILAIRYWHPNRATLVSQHGRFLEWDGKYTDVTVDVSHAIVATVQDEFDRLSRVETAAHAARLRAIGEATRAKAAMANGTGVGQPLESAKSSIGDPPRVPVARAVTSRKIGDVRIALASLVSLPSAVVMPAFIDKAGRVVDGPFPARGDPTGQLHHPPDGQGAARADRAEPHVLLDDQPAL